MKDFMSEYGWLVVVGVIIVIAVAMSTPFGSAVKDAILQFVEKFSNAVSI